jgi:hypothetical protein
MYKKTRDNFSNKVKDDLAKRVGNRCSKCEKITSGPSQDGGSKNIGVAAHICAASPGGPRHEEHMTTKERADIDNGIWLCQNCAAEIDRDTTRYSVQELHKLKKQAEERAHEEINNSNSALMNKFSKTVSELCQEANIITLLAETSGNCMKCGRPLGINIDDVPVSYTKIIHLSDNDDIPVCVECETETQNLSDAEKNHLLSEKRLLEKNAAARDAVSRHKIDNQVQEVLETIQDMEVNETTKLKIDPVAVENKISEKRLKENVLHDVIRFYDGVNSALDRLSGENRLNVDKFAMKIKRMFEDASENLTSQSDIYNLLVEELFIKTGRKHREACAIIISYFVQRCEVFNEIAK